MNPTYSLKFQSELLSFDYLVEVSFVALTSEVAFEMASVEMASVALTSEVEFALASALAVVVDSIHKGNLHLQEVRIPLVVIGLHYPL